jgi:hypothetical protein
MMTTFTMLMMLIALHLSPLLQQPPVVIVMVATVSHDQSRDQALTLRLPSGQENFRRQFSSGSGSTDAQEVLFAQADSREQLAGI